MGIGGIEREGQRAQHTQGEKLLHRNSHGDSSFQHGSKEYGTRFGAWTAKSDGFDGVNRHKLPCRPSLSLMNPTGAFSLLNIGDPHEVDVA
jgi:hypothetical protein